MSFRKSFLFNRVTLTPFGFEYNEIINKFLENKSGIKHVKESWGDNFPVKYCGQIDWKSIGFDLEIHKYRSLYAIKYLLNKLLPTAISRSIDQVICLVSPVRLSEFDTWWSNQNTNTLEAYLDEVDTIDFIWAELHRKHITVEKKNIMLVENTCTSGNCVMGFAYQGIKTGRWDSCIVLAVDPVDPFNLLSLNNLGALSNSNADPTKASRPFDLERSGFVKSEAAAMALIGTKEYGKSNHLSVIPIEIMGFSQTSDAYRLTDGRDDAEGAVMAMELAIRDAQIDKGELAFVKAHGTGTKLNDQHEALALTKVFGQNPIPVTSLKGHMGHVTDASGLVESLIAAEALIQNVILPTKNCDYPEFEIDVVQKPRAAQGKKCFLSNTLGFGGNNSSVVLRIADLLER